MQQHKEMYTFIMALLYSKQLRQPCLFLCFFCGVAKTQSWALATICCDNLTRQKRCRLSPYGCVETPF